MFLNRNLSAEEREGLEKLRGQSLPLGDHAYQDCASISIPAKGTNNDVEVFVNGSVTRYASVEDACKALVGMKPPPRHLIMDTRENADSASGIPLLGALDAATLERYGFHYVVDSGFLRRMDSRKNRNASSSSRATMRRAGRRPIK